MSPVPHVEFGMDSDAYRASPGLSHSESKTLRKTPFHFHQLSLPRDPSLVKAPSPQMAMGTMVHAATLEPLTFEQHYRIGPEGSKNAKAWKDFAQRCEEDGVEAISQQQHDVAHAMAAAVRSTLPEFASVLQGAACEVSLWWHCPATGVLCKARPDVCKRYPPGITVVPDPEHGLTEERAALMLERGFALLADLKTTEDASADGFSRSVAEYSYHTQAHWYCEGVEAAMGIPVLSFLFAVIEREYPYACASYTLDDDAMRVAADLNDSARERYRQCKQAGEWPGYPSGTQDISLPYWYVKRFNEGLIT